MDIEKRTGKRLMDERKRRRVPYGICGYPAALITCLDDFLQHLKGLHRSPGTISKYKDNLLLFIDWFAKRNLERFQDADVRLIDEFCVEHRNLGFSRHTIYSTKVTLRLFFRHLKERGLIFDDPMAAVEIRKPQRILGLVLSHGQVARILSAPHAGTLLGLRDGAILETLYSTGIRCSELVGMTVKDASLGNGTIRVVGKGKRERIVPIGSRAVDAVERYLSESRPALQNRGPLTDALWLGCRSANTLKNQGLLGIVKKYAHASGLPDGTDVHSFRRTCATHLLEGGAHPVLIAEMLGHSDLTTLAHYLRTTARELLLTHAKTNPGQ